METEKVMMSAEEVLAEIEALHQMYLEKYLEQKGRFIGDKEKETVGFWHSHVAMEQSYTFLQTANIEYEDEVKAFKATIKDINRLLKSSPYQKQNDSTLTALKEAKGILIRELMKLKATDLD